MTPFRVITNNFTGHVEMRKELYSSHNAEVNFTKPASMNFSWTHFREISSS
jgi:hypothetical protein